jgi:hypothetical protein
LLYRLSYPGIRRWRSWELNPIGPVCESRLRSRRHPRVAEVGVDGFEPPRWSFTATAVPRLSLPICENRRGGGDRTHDLTVPNRARCRCATPRWTKDWSGRRESNPRYRRGMPGCHHNTSTATRTKISEESARVELADLEISATRLADGHLAPMQDGLSITWRRGRDSNPSRPCRVSGFRDRYHHPLAAPPWGIAVPPPGIEPGSSGFQPDALTMCARAGEGFRCQRARCATRHAARPGRRQSPGTRVAHIAVVVDPDPGFEPGQNGSGPSVLPIRPVRKNGLPSARGCRVESSVLACRAHTRLPSASRRAFGPLAKWHLRF